MKKIALLFGLLLLLPFATALTEGQIITQQQLDNADVGSFDLECQLDQTNHRFSQLTLVYELSCFSLLQNGDSYTIIREPLIVEYHINLNEIRRIVDRARETNLQTAITEFKQQMIRPYVRQEFNQFRDGIRDQLKEFQTFDISGYDWDITLE